MRLWHVSSSRCIRVFPHTDFITSVAFHPIQHRYFISGSFDNRIRLWNILEHRVVEWAQTAHFVTACAFSPSGQMLVAGLHHGQCVFYQTQGLKYYTQLDCRNRQGKHKRGKKVTGLDFSGDGRLLLVTTNDSRVRAYRMQDFSLVCKMKGVENEQLQIRAAFSEDGQHVVMGSDKEFVAVWRMPDRERAGGGGGEAGGGEQQDVLLQPLALLSLRIHQLAAVALLALRHCACVRPASASRTLGRVVVVLLLVRVFSEDGRVRVLQGSGRHGDMRDLPPALRRRLLVRRRVGRHHARAQHHPHHRHQRGDQDLSQQDAETAAAAHRSIGQEMSRAALPHSINDTLPHTSRAQSLSVSSALPALAPSLGSAMPSSISSAHDRMTVMSSPHASGQSSGIRAVHSAVTVQTRSPSCSILGSDGGQDGRAGTEGRVEE